MLNGLMLNEVGLMLQIVKDGTDHGVLMVSISTLRSNIRAVRKIVRRLTEAGYVQSPEQLRTTFKMLT